MENLEFTNIGWQLGLPLILMVIDIVTGYYNAWKNKDIKSAKMRDGMGKKLAEVAFITIMYCIGFAFDMTYLGACASGYVIFMELMSVLENCDKLGMPIPKWLKDKVNNNIETIQKGGVKNETKTKMSE